MDPQDEVPIRSPESMAKADFNFNLLKPAAAPVLSPRLGRVTVEGRKPISTPHYVPLTSRGAVSHLTQDVVRDHTSISSLYVGLEDCMGRRSVTERAPRTPPVFKTPAAPHESALRKFICFPEDTLVVMGPRRIPAIVCPTVNTDSSIAISTSVGFQQLSAEQYIDAVRGLRPDIVIGLADLMVGKPPGVKRRGKMVDRTHAYTMDATEELYNKNAGEEGEVSKTAYFAPVLPLDNAEQSIYLEDLQDEMGAFVSGLALYESASLSIIPESLGDLPRLLLSEPVSPQEVLRDVSLGADLLTIPFIGSCSDAGIALDFVFPTPSPPPATTTAPETPRALGIDLWSPIFTTDTTPISATCHCYACQNHHRAYIHHLLSAKEMLAWTLLQIHNYHTMDRFFSGIRESINRGTFERHVQAFELTYESNLPEQTGQGPRLRGYQLPASGPHQPRRNPRVFGRLDDAAEKFSESQSSIATPDTGADELQEHGFAEKKVS